MLRRVQQHTSSHTSSFSVLLYFFFLFQFQHAKASDHHIFIYAGCSQEKYPQNSPFQNNLNSLLSSMVTSSSHALYNSFAPGNDTSQAVYGLYQCRGDLKTRDCSACVANLVSQIQLVCPYNYRATLQLDRCFVRYEDIDFLGKLDTNLRFHKCGKGNGNGDVEFLKRRDDVLGDLQQAGSGFRVSSSGSVEGYAQCVGDLNGADCSTCLADAVTQLGNLCGSAAAADVFLAQCYARYWASGYYDSSGTELIKTKKK